MAGPTHRRGVRARVTDLGITCMFEDLRGYGEARGLPKARAEIELGLYSIWCMEGGSKTNEEKDEHI